MIFARESLRLYAKSVLEDFVELLKKDFADENKFNINLNSYNPVDQFVNPKAKTIEITYKVNDKVRNKINEPLFEIDLTLVTDLCTPVFSLPAGSPENTNELIADLFHSYITTHLRGAAKVPETFQQKFSNLCSTLPDCIIEDFDINLNSYDIGVNTSTPGYVNYQGDFHFTLSFNPKFYL